MRRAATPSGGGDDSGSVSERGVNRPIRILVVDDHPVVRYGLVGLLSAEADFEVVGEAASCAECCEKISELSPDVVVLDLEMEDACGAEALTRVRNTDPDVRTIVYTAYDNDWRVVDAVKNGVDGYLMKETPTQNIFDAIRIVNKGGSFLDPAVTSKVMGQVGSDRNRRKTADRYLSDREKTVLRLLAKGKRNKEISRELCISERTVKFHVSTLLGKLQASNRTEAVKIAAEQGLISL